MTDVPDGAAETVTEDTGAQDFDEATERIPELIGTLGAHPDTTVRQQVDELLQCVDRVHRQALTRLAGLLQHHSLLDHACGDPLVGTLFDLYDLAPEEVEEEPPPPPPPSKTRVVTSFGAGPVAPKGSSVIGLTDLKRFPLQGPAAAPAAAAEPASPLARAAEPTSSAPESPAAVPEPAAAPPPQSTTPPVPEPPALPPPAVERPSPPAATAPAAVPAFRPGQYPVASFPEGSARASSSWEPPSPGGSAAAVGKAALEMGMTGLPGFGIPRPRPKGAEDAAPDGAPVEPDPSLALPPTGGASFDLRAPRSADDPESPFGFDLLGGGMESLKSRPVRPGTLPPAAAAAEPKPAAAEPKPIAVPAASQAAAPAERVPSDLGPTEAAPSPAPAAPVAAGGSYAKPANEPDWTELFSTDYVPMDTVAASSDQRVLVINSGGTLHAVLNRCGGGPLPLTFAKVNGNRLLCPWHRDCDYDIAKGEAANGRRLVNYPLRVQDGIIQVDLANGWATGPLTPEQRVSPIR